MKNLAVFILFLLILSCNQKKGNIPAMVGAYSMTTQVLNDGTKDSVLDRKQLKNVYINSKGDSSVNNNPLEYKTFQSGYFIWAITVKDSANKKTSVFGYGPFVMDGKNKSKETVVNTTFASGLLGKTYEVEIEYPSADIYKQTITFAKGEKSIEIYQKLK